MQLSSFTLVGRNKDTSQVRSLWETPEMTIKRLERENQKITKELNYEKLLRYQAETKVNTEEQKPQREPRTYSEFKSDGKRKARPAEPVRSYEDFVAMQQYFLSKGKIRDWMLWTIGVSLGLRISDLFNLKIKSFLNPDLTFRRRLLIYEQKTGKVNGCLITEAVVDAMTRYFDSIKWRFELNDYLFKSMKTKGKMYEEYGWKIISDAAKALNFPFNVGSHTMRKTFANIVVCADKTTVDMNAITKIQGLLNHSDQKCTMKYLGTFNDMYDRARQAVSDFVLGKTNIHELTLTTSISPVSMEDVMNKLEALESIVAE